MKSFFYLLLLTIMTSCHNYHVLKTGLEGSTIPAIDLQLTDSITHVNTANLSNGKATVLFFFQPYCPFCRAQTVDIVSNIKELSGIHFCLLTNASMDQTRSYEQEYGLQKFSNITVARDTSLNFAKYFNAKIVPYIAVYNPNEKLQKVLIGRADVKDIKNIALE